MFHEDNPFLTVYSYFTGQVSVADAVQHSFSALRSSMETRGEQSLPQNPQDRSEDSMEEPVQEKEM